MGSWDVKESFFSLFQLLSVTFSYFSYYQLLIVHNSDYVNLHFLRFSRLTDEKLLYLICHKSQIVANHLCKDYKMK